MLTEIIRSLPKDLQIKISCAFYGPAIENLELFKQGAWKGEESQLTRELALRMESRVYQPGDALMLENRLQDELLYVREGKVWSGRMTNEYMTDNVFEQLT